MGQDFKHIQPINFPNYVRPITFTRNSCKWIDVSTEGTARKWEKPTVKQTSLHWTPIYPHDNERIII